MYIFQHMSYVTKPSFWSRIGSPWLRLGSNLARMNPTASRNLLKPLPALREPISGPKFRKNPLTPIGRCRELHIYICIYGGCVDILPTIWQGQKIYALGLLLWPVDFVISASGASSHCADHSQLHAAAPPARPGDGASPEGPIVCNIAALKGRLIGS